MVFSSYEELMAVVEERRAATLTLEIDMGNVFSPEHEAAKAELAKAEAMETLTGGAFLANNLDTLRARVADTRPPSQSIWAQFSKLDLDTWSDIMKKFAGNALDQYDQVLPKCFIGLFGEDPAPEEEPEGWVKPEPLTTNPLSVSPKGGAMTVLPGGSLNSVVQNFMAWQNSGGEVSIRPTKSGRD